MLLALVACLTALGDPARAPSRADAADTSQPATGEAWAILPANTTDGSDTGPEPEPAKRSEVDCASLGWGSPAAGPATWVSASAAPGGDGTEAAPLDDLAAALATTSGPAVVWVDAGAYAGPLSLDDGGIAVIGRGAGLTTVSHDDAGANLESDAGEGGQNQVCGLTLQGGKPGAVVESGTLALYGVEVAGATQAGLLAVGAATALHLEDVAVHDTLALAPLSAGLSIGDGGSAVVLRSTFTDNQGMGIGAMSPGGTLEVAESALSRNGNGPDETWGGGLVAGGLDSASVSDTLFADNVYRGLEAVDVAPFDLARVEVSGTYALGHLAYGVHTIASQLRIEDINVHGGDGTGISVDSGGQIAGTTVRATDVAVNALGEGGVGVALGANTRASLKSLQASGNDRVGLVVAYGQATCRSCTLSQNGQAGAWHSRAYLDLEDAVVTDNGLVGITGDGSDRPVEIRDSAFGPHPYAAIWATRRLTLEDSAVWGSEGIEVEGVLVGGHALYLQGSWSQLSGNSFAGSSTIGLLLDGFDGSVAGNTWDNTGYDLVTVWTYEPETIDGLDEVPDYALNPVPTPDTPEPPLDGALLLRAL